MVHMDRLLQVAAVSGDARRALDICRRATEVAEVKNDTCVTMLHVDAALQEMFSSPKIAAIRSEGTMPHLAHNDTVHDSCQL